MASEIRHLHPVTPQDPKLTPRGTCRLHRGLCGVEGGRRDRWPISGGCNEALPWLRKGAPPLQGGEGQRQDASFLRLTRLEARGAALGVLSATTVSTSRQGAGQTCWPTGTLSPLRKRPHANLLQD